MIQQNIQKLRSDIDQVCQRIGRNPNEVTLIGVTKFACAQDVQIAVNAGITDIGENRVVDARLKFLALREMKAPFRRHLIGHLQSNKAKLAVEIFDIIQSVDTKKLARELEKAAADQNKVVDVLVQVNVSAEEQKFGVEPACVSDLLETISLCDHLRCRGLMTIAPLTEDEDVIRQCFRGLRELFDQCQRLYPDHPRVRLRDLSMGMSSDFTIALEEGATMIRVGSAIFNKD